MSERPSNASWKRKASTCAVRVTDEKHCTALRNGPRPCLILLDLNMAGMDGWEFRRRQLLWPQMASIPVVVVSGAPELKAVTRTMQAAEVWRKPVGVDVLIRAVGDHCHGHAAAL